MKTTCYLEEIDKNQYLDHSKYLLVIFFMEFMDF